MKVTRLFAATLMLCAAPAPSFGCNGGGARHAIPFPQAGGTTATGGVSAAGGLAGGGPAGGGAGTISDGGAGGMAGSAGVSTSGSGGSAEGGEGGGDDDGGAAGEGASAAGGAGAAGTSGSATGSGGIAGGGAAGRSASGGAAGSMSGAAGSAGSFGGFAGMPGPVAACGERCNLDTDCRVLSTDLGYRCSASHRCERLAEPCHGSEDCLPDASFWIFSCATDDDCFFFTDDVCVNVGGVGRCARLAPSANGCDVSNPDEITLPRFGTSGSALVCATANRACVSGACIVGCKGNADCSSAQNGSICDTGAGLCRCVRDGDCGGPGVSHCNLATGSCECDSARDCEEIPNANACLGGRCGCSAVTACNSERRFSGTTYVCE